MNLIGLPKPLAVLEPQSQSEVIAAMSVEAIAGYRCLRGLDPGGGETQLADFAFTDSSGDDQGRLEITTTTRRDRSSFGREVSKLNWEAPSLTWSWTVKARDTSRIKRLRKEIEPHLAALEGDGRTDHWIPDQPALGPSDPGALPDGLINLGVLAVCAFHHHAPEETAWIAVTPEIPGGFYSRNAVAWEVQAEVDKPDNQVKLQIPGSIRSELFVWLDVGHGQAALSTLTTSPFDQTLNEIPVLDLPSGLTGAWAASGLASWPRPVSALLFCDGAAWQIIEPPELDYDDQRLEGMLGRLIAK